MVRLLALTTLAALACTHPRANTPRADQANLDATAGDKPATKPVETAPPAPAPAPERWAATAVDGAQLVDFVVVFSGPTATLEVAGQSLPLADVTHEADTLAFTLQKPGVPENQWEHFKLARHGEVALGTVKIGPHEGMAKLVKLGPDDAPHSAFARPQEAALVRPPPYEERELVIDAPDGGKLAGTLTVPSVGKPPYPVLVLLSGSGQQDRDETIFGHKPFLLVSDAVTRAGIATYRFDDRGTGKTVGAPVSLDTEVADAGAVIDALKRDKALDPKRVGVLGHSASGAVAAMTALHHPVGFVVLLAGTTLPGGAYSAYQTEHALRAAGATDAQVKEQQAAQAKVSAAIVKGPKAVEQALTELVKPQLAHALGHEPTKDDIAQAIAKPLAESTNPWVVSYFKLDPRVAWAKLRTVPVLLLVGDKDTQVPADLTIKALEDATGHRKTVTTMKLAGLNHLFQHATTGELDEYVTIDETIAPAVLDTLVSWLGTVSH